MEAENPSRTGPNDLARLLVRDRSRAQVPMALLEALSTYLHGHGLDPAVALPELAAALSKPGLARYPVDGYCDLLYKAARTLDDPYLGLHFGQSISPSDLGALGYLFLSCDSLGETLIRLQRYHRLINEVTPLANDVEGDALVLRWGISHGRMGALYDESGIASIVACARRLSGLHLAPRAIGFVNSAPSDTGPYISYFGCPVLWDQAETSIVVSLQSLHLRQERPDRQLLRLMERQIDQDMATLRSAAQDIEADVRTVVCHVARFGIPELPSVAAELQLSSKVLYRRLALAGLNFRYVRDNALRDLAQDLLMRRDMSLAEVAHRLGYTEASAFTRAFKRWTGASPLRWRVAHQRPDDTEPRG
jgi:AraC-like DNA-binding protein